MTTSTAYEFEFATEGGDHRYIIAPVYTPDGYLRKFSISQDEPSDETKPVIHIDMDPQAFRQTAMPNAEVLSRIAIGQAHQDNLFGSPDRTEGMFLDFAVEPWVGELKPRALNS